MKICTTCKKQVKIYTKINCPECGEELIRCKHCKEMALEYKCKCGFKGP